MTPLPIIGKGRILVCDMLSDNSLMEATEVKLQKDPEDGWTIGMRFLAYCIQKASLSYPVTSRVDDGDMGIINNIETTGRLIGFDIETSKDDPFWVYMPHSIQSEDTANDLIEFFGGNNHGSRHIPNRVFNTYRESQIAFLAGMFDAPEKIMDGELRFVCNNRERTLQLMILIRSLGERATTGNSHSGYHAVSAMFSPELCETFAENLASSEKTMTAPYDLRIPFGTRY